MHGVVTIVAPSEMTLVELRRAEGRMAEERDRGTDPDDYLWSCPNCGVRLVARQ